MFLSFLNVTIKEDNLSLIKSESSLKPYDLVPLIFLALLVYSLGFPLDKSLMTNNYN